MANTSVTSDMQEQINATIWLINNNLFPLDEAAKNYLQSHLTNLVETCLWLAAGKPSASQKG